MADQKEPVVLNEAPPSLATKLSIIMGELGNVEKKGHNKAQNYNFVREADVVAAVVPLLAKNHVFLHTSVTSHSRKPLYLTQSGLQMWITTVTVEGTWIDGDSGEKLPAATFIGYGADTGDKGVYKAMTGAEKYILLKSFLISTGDDPEGDEKVDTAAAAAGAARGAVRVRRGNQPGVQRGGQSGVATTAQITAIAKLAKDLGLEAEDVVPIIKKVVGSEPGEGQTIRQWLGSLTSQQAGDIIAAMSETDAHSDGGQTVENSADDQAETDEKVEEPSLSVV